ncbi:MAG: nucleotide exchange factor GrpE [bacterium]
MDQEEDIKIEPEVEDSEATEESEDPERSEGEKENKIAKIREELNACRKEKQEYMDGWQRAKADYVNLLKRIEEDAKASELRGKIKAVETLLPAFDALERAKEHLPAGRQVVNTEGFMAIAKQIESAFASLGLEEIGKVGEKFNPVLHEAFGQDKVDSIEEDDIITVILDKGWRVGEVVIRPTKVRVGHYS